MNRDRLADIIVDATQLRYAYTGAEGDFDDARRHYKQASDMELISGFCTEVGWVVQTQYGLTDGSDLCWHIIEHENRLNTFLDNQTVDSMARMVAQRLAQP